MRTLLYVALGLVVVAGGTHHASTPAVPAAAAPAADTGGGVSPGAVLLLIVGAVVVWALSRGVRGGSSSPPPLPHADGMTRRKVKRHELAHQRALRRAGGGGSSRRVWRDPAGGWQGRTRPHSWARFRRLPPEHQIAVYAAGVHGAPGTNGRRDEQGKAWVLARVPRRDRARVAAAGEELGRRWAR